MSDTHDPHGTPAAKGKEKRKLGGIIILALTTVFLIIVLLSKSNNNQKPTEPEILVEQIGVKSFNLASEPVMITTIEYYVGKRWRLKTSVDCMVSTDPGNPSKTWEFPANKHTVIPLHEGDPLYVWSKSNAGEPASFFYESK